MPPGMASASVEKARPEPAPKATEVNVKAADGGFIVQPITDDMGRMPKPHVCKDAAELHTYIDQALGIASAPAEPAPAPEPASNPNIRMDSYEAAPNE